MICFFLFISYLPNIYFVGRGVPVVSLSNDNNSVKVNDFKEVIPCAFEIIIIKFFKNTTNDDYINEVKQII